MYGLFWSTWSFEVADLAEAALTLRIDGKEGSIQVVALQDVSQFLDFLRLLSGDPLLALLVRRIKNDLEFRGPSSEPWHVLRVRIHRRQPNPW